MWFFFCSRGNSLKDHPLSDIDLGRWKPVYLSDLTAYHLKQRNSYLKTANIQLFLDVLDEQCRLW